MAAVCSFSFFSPSPSYFSKSHRPLKPSIFNLQFQNSALLISLNFPPLDNPPRRLVPAMCSVKVAETAAEEKTENPQQPNEKRKLFVLNLPWSLTVADIKELFGQCGTVSDVEIIKEKGGRNREYVFVTMASGDEAQAAVDKLDSHQVSGRIIRVDFARRFKKPSLKPPPSLLSSKESFHKLYISNLAWKVRSTHLREFFSTANFKPVSARAVFETEGRAAGYGFVSFATEEEAKAAISELDGKELMGRPIVLKFSERNANESENQNVVKDEENLEVRPDE